MEEILFWNNGFRQPYWYIFLYSKLMVNHPDAGETDMTYDAAGNLLTKLTAELRKSISDKGYISYTYDFERLHEVLYPENLFNRVTYTYGKAGDKYNRAGRLALVEDASGGEAYYYGRQGEVTKTVRTVMASVADIRTYVYGATYDSWNRVQTMTYPDGEVVTYHYNAAGQVESMTSNKQGRQSVIVDRIGYDKEGHTVYTKLGNGTETTYTYDKQRERLQVMNFTADGQTVMENRYRYDAVDNILGITNAANPTSLTKLNKAKLGGRSSHTYEYDELNRLVHANGKAKSASYDMVMSFGRMSEPLTKVQKVDSTTTAKSYNFAYKYEDSNHPTAPTLIGHDHYTYDANGNPTLVTNDSTNTTREMYWDEDNRLMVLSDNGKTSRYTYNAAGERIMKSYGTMEGAYGDPENTGVGYNAVLTELGNHDVPQGWIQTPRPNTTPNTNPGPPVSWNDPSNPDDPQAGYGYIPNDTTKEETFFYHSDHLGSTSYITDDHANITQYDVYLPYGELLVDEHSSSEDLPYKFNGKQFDEETGLYYYGARYLNPMASIWYGVDPIREMYVANSCYIYCLNNPIIFIDPNGKKVKIVNDVNQGLSVIRGTLPKKLRKFVAVTDGYIDKGMMEQGLLAMGDNISDNYLSLYELVSDKDKTVEFAVTSDKSAKDKNGNLMSPKDIPLSFNDPVCDVYSDNKPEPRGSVGYTLAPLSHKWTKNDELQRNQLQNPLFSVNGNYRVEVNGRLLKYRELENILIQAAAHELYSHTLFMFRGIDALHNVSRTGGNSNEKLEKWQRLRMNEANQNFNNQ